MEHSKEFIEQLIQRYINGKATDDELELFFQWVKEGKLDTILNERMDLEIITLKNQPLVRTPKSTLRRMMKRNPIRIAAVVMVFLLVGFTMKQYHTTIMNWLDPVEYIRVQTARTEIKEISLPDGSTVWLNAGSTFEYPESFRGNNREVKLPDGEAFFSVQHDTGKPFIVWSSGVKTQVLGTTFNVRSYDNLENIQVTVASGKVAVKKITQGTEVQGETLLEANDQASIGKQTGVISKSKVNAREATGWREGKLFFNNERFADVASILANRYDIQIIFADPAIKDYRFSAAFEATDDLHVVFDALSLANGLSYTVHNNMVTLKKN